MRVKIKIYRQDTALCEQTVDSAMGGFGHLFGEPIRDEHGRFLLGYEVKFIYADETPNPMNPK